MDPRPAWIIPLKEIKPSDLPRVGGKALHLARLHRNGYRVPDGFCLIVDGHWGIVTIGKPEFELENKK